MEFEYVTATDMDRAWLNFELDLPLEVEPDGPPNPFYVNRPGNPVAELEQALLAPFYRMPKYFFSGHRGCGKSTELRRLAVNPEIRAKYWPIHFTIRDEADVNNLDYRDVLLAIGGQIYRQYRAGGGRLPKQLLSELDQFRGQVEKEITITPGRLAGSEVEGKLDGFFAQAGLKLKLEPRVRTAVRQVIEADITGLIELLNTVSTTIYAKTERWPLVLIDDLDKPDLARACEIFYDHRGVMLQPNIAIVYTVSSPLFYSPQFEAIRDQAVFLPNVKLHPRRRADERDADGYCTMADFVHRRVHPDLIAQDALDEAIQISGGVFREMCRVMRYAIGRARVKAASRIELDDVQRAGSEIRNEYRRILTAEQRALLREVHAHNRLDHPDALAPLMQMLAVLEYRNDENWCDVHPALLPLLAEGLVARERDDD
ncbi:MAG TPA: hypothetical protein ENN99_06910 [Chloroflexi bacterium]|nr:hypothetical protein [Chloroflexota bacterium]